MIYLGCATLLLADALFMLFNFKYSYNVYLKERKIHHINTTTEERSVLNDEHFNEMGLYRSLVKIFVYWFWFIAGFFTFLWPIHCSVFLINLISELSVGGKINISTFSFFFKLFLYLSVYLTTIITLLTSY